MTKEQKELVELDYANWLYDEGKRMPELKLREIGDVVRNYEIRKKREWKEMSKLYDGMFTEQDMIEIYDEIADKKKGEPR
jgi:hypothetical protein